MKNKAVVLLSGGLDSTTTLAIAKNQGFEVYALSFDYGQRHRVELEKAKEIAQQFSVVDHQIMTIDLRQFGGSALTDSIDVPTNRDEEEMSGNSNHLRPGSQHHFSFFLSGIRGSEKSSKYFFGSQRSGL